MEISGAVLTQSHQPQPVQSAPVKPVQQSVKVELMPERRMESQKSEYMDVVQKKKAGENVGIAEAKLIEAIEKANKALLTPPTELHLSVHEKTNRVSVKIMNTETKEVIKEIPPEKVLDMMAKMWEIAGIVVDTKG